MTWLSETYYETVVIQFGTKFYLNNNSIFSFLNKEKIKYHLTLKTIFIDKRVLTSTNRRVGARTSYFGSARKNVPSRLNIHAWSTRDGAFLPADSRWEVHPTKYTKSTSIPLKLHNRKPTKRPKDCPQRCQPSYQHLFWHHPWSPLKRKRKRNLHKQKRRRTRQKKEKKKKTIAHELRRRVRRYRVSSLLSNSLSPSLRDTGDELFQPQNLSNERTRARIFSICHASRYTPASSSV